MKVGGGVGEGVSVGTGVSVADVVPVGTALASIAPPSFADTVGGIVGGISTRENAGKSNATAVGATAVSTVGLSKVTVAVGMEVGEADCWSMLCTAVIAGPAVI